MGIEISSGEYITFIDSDDSLNNNFLKESYNIIKENNLDLIIGGYNEIKNNKVTRTRLSMPGLHIYEGTKITNFFEKLLSSKTTLTISKVSSFNFFTFSFTFSFNSIFFTSFFFNFDYNK